jgi:hypothetical protein
MSAKAAVFRSKSVALADMLKMTSAEVVDAAMALACEYAAAAAIALPARLDAALAATGADKTGGANG